jgi:hypothetical protein
MKRFLIVAALAIVAVPAALAVPPAADQSASQLCKEQRKVMGMANFRALYAPTGSPQAAMNACLAKQVTVASTVAKNAAKECKAEQASLGVEAFNAKYGTNPNKKNAFGKCVSSTAAELEEEQQQATLNAAKKCKAERVSLGVAAFNAKYGTNANKKHAFGKCVSMNAKNPVT